MSGQTEGNRTRTSEAAEAIRSLVEEIRLVPENGRLEIELTGNLAGILALASGSKKPVSARDRLQVTLIAGDLLLPWVTPTRCEPV